MSDPVSVLVVAHQTAANDALLEAVHERAQHGPVRFHMVVPRQPHGIHKVVDHSPWLAQHSYVIGAAALAIAGAFQFSELKERCLTECRHPGAFLLKHYDRGPGAGRW